MKVTIHGKRFDTEKSIFVGEADRGLCGTMNHWRAELRVMPQSKSFFLVGYGGAMTRWGGRKGSGIIPIDQEFAKIWSEAYLSDAEHETHFGKIHQTPPPNEEIEVIPIS